MPEEDQQDNQPQQGQQQGKQEKNPVEGAANKLKEALNKELGNKIDAQLKVVVTAYKAFKAELKKWEDLKDEVKEDKAELADILKEVV